MRVFLDTIGCRLNQSEIETMARQLVAGGHEVVTDSAVADTIILNTCAVTAEAARDARTLTRRFHRQNTQAQIVLTGCYATLAPQELSQLPGVSRVVNNREKPHLVQRLAPAPSVDLPLYEQEPFQRDIHPGTIGRTRAFIKVQDGCDNKCTFCVTTLARGASQSRHLGDVVAEIQTAATAGYQEAVLTGVHLGSYGHDLGNQHGLYELVAAILHHTDIPRVRLSSLEPWDIDPDFFRLWQNPRLMPHLHLPLQSGSDKILRRMARRTNQATFRRLVEAARANLPDLNLSTDVIVGFPGETETEFAESMAYVAEIQFSRLHVFSYSPRPGTAASVMPHQIPGPVKRERTQRMIELGRTLSLNFHRQHEEQQATVLWESVVGADENGLRWSGHTDNYIRVMGYGVNLQNRILPTRLFDAQVDGMRGEALL